MADGNTFTKTPKKEGKNFTDEEVERLISEWSKEEVLFNCRHQDYFKKDARGAAIQPILESLNKEGKSLISAKQIVYFLEISLQYSLHLLNMKMDNLIKHNVLCACCSFAQKKRKQTRTPAPRVVLRS